MSTRPELTTQRLKLRAPAAGDAPRIAELCNDFDVCRMTTRMPYPYGLEDAEGFLQAVATNDISREIVFAIEDERDGLVGVLGFHPAEPFGPEIGYWFGRPYWGRGYATEAAEAATLWAHEAWGKRVVVAGHFADNPASGNVLIKAGFLYTGEVQHRHSTARGGPTPTRMMVRLP